MLIESEWPGDAIAVPVLDADDREDEMFTGPDEGLWTPTDILPEQSGEALDRCDFAKPPHRRRWIGLLTSILGELRSRIRRRREIRRMSTGWAMVDDRMLKDIGISRLEVEHAGNARHWG